MAKAWFSNIRKRKHLLSCADNKISAVIDLIVKKHPRQRIMVFSETLDSINKLKLKLELEQVASTVIDSTISSADRQKILSGWGKDFYILLSVHTLEIGYDVPEVGIEIILATTSNMNQVIQRIGRIVRKYEGKKNALIYVVYVSDTKDDNILEIVNKAVQMGERRSATINGESGEEALRIKRAYNILELNSYEPIIVEEEDSNNNQKLFLVRSSKEKDKFYRVNPEIKTCSCPDFKFNNSRCKHIIASELVYDHKL
jgi:superfamily II DNA or RNA helicase